MTSQIERAQAFRAMHAGPEILILPNAWDAASAALMEMAGASAVATSSAAVAWSLGYPDGNALPVDRLLSTLEAISRSISVPLTADIEAGYADDPGQVRETISRVIGAGAVGINIEDGKGDPDLLVRKVEAARAAAEAAGVPLFVNARIDVYLYRLAEGDAALAETLSRARRYQAAGADGVFVPGPVAPDLIGRLAQEIDLPLNVMGRSGAPSARALQDLGVARLSSATGPFRAAYATLAKAMEAFMRDGDAATLASSGEGLPDLNARFAGR